MASIYVASSNEDKEAAREAMRFFTLKGFAVHDWTKRIEKPFPEKADHDYDELCKSDHVVFVNASRVTPGKYIEIGTCRALKKSTFFIGKPVGVVARFGHVVKDVEEVLSIIRRR